jgi:hypothetical protein
VEGGMVASMQAMNENNVISSFKIFIDADCSNLGGDAKNWAKCAEIQGTEKSTDNGGPKRKSPILCKMFSRKQRGFGRIFESFGFVNN